MAFIRLTAIGDDESRMPMYVAIDRIVLFYPCPGRDGGVGHGTHVVVADDNPRDGTIELSVVEGAEEIADRIGLEQLAR